MHTNILFLLYWNFDYNIQKLSLYNCYCFPFQRVLQLYYKTRWLKLLLLLATFFRILSLGIKNKWAAYYWWHVLFVFQNKSSIKVLQNKGKPEESIHVSHHDGLCFMDKRFVNCLQMFTNFCLFFYSFALMEVTYCSLLSRFFDWWKFRFFVQIVRRYDIFRLK